MSKTFKALQRAAKERAAKTGPVSVPTPRPAPVRKDPPSAAAARLIAVQREHEKDADPPTPLAVTPPEPGPGDERGLHGEMDAGLHQLLEETFGRAVPVLAIGGDGWVEGRLDPALRSDLLQRYDLLHCLVRDEERSFWFWGSAREARELADRSGYDLDPD